MGATKNGQYKVFNGTDYDVINFKTTANNVSTTDGNTVQNKIDSLNENITNVTNDLATHKEDTMLYSTYKLNADNNGIFTEIQYKRKDGTLLMKSVLSGGTTSQYSTRTETWYKIDGTTTDKILVYNLIYDSDGNVISEVVQ